MITDSQNKVCITDEEELFEALLPLLDQEGERDGVKLGFLSYEDDLTSGIYGNPVDLDDGFDT
jgi:hypothetical protein